VFGALQIRECQHDLDFRHVIFEKLIDRFPCRLSPLFEKILAGYGDRPWCRCCSGSPEGIKRLAAGFFSYPAS
jgi:hypothetical protein